MAARVPPSAHDATAVGGYEELARALTRFGSARAEGLPAPMAAAALGYEDIHELGSFVLTAEGVREYLQPSAEQTLPDIFEWMPYEKLEALDPDGTAWRGVAC